VDQEGSELESFLKGDIEKIIDSKNREIMFEEFQELRQEVKLLKNLILVEKAWSRHVGELLGSVEWTWLKDHGFITSEQYANYKKVQSKLYFRRRVSAEAQLEFDKYRRRS
jgi:hypothetical protein